MGPSVISPDEQPWLARPQAAGEPARHVAELTHVAGMAHVRANVWRYEPGAAGRRHRHPAQDETFVVLAGTLSMYLGDPPERRDVPAGSLVHVPAGTPLPVPLQRDLSLPLVSPGSEAELVADAAHEVARVEAELLQLVAVLLGVDLVRKLLLGLRHLVVGAAVAKHLDDLVLGDFHARAVPEDGGARFRPGAIGGSASARLSGGGRDGWPVRGSGYRDAL